MISRVYLKDCLSFEEVDLEFDKGLNVFTGPSGAGKSVLMEAVLSLFGIAEVKASLSEVCFDEISINSDNYDISKGDELIIKAIKKEKVRFFFNNQTISKKNLQSFSSKLIKHLSLKDTSEFQSTKLVEFLDSLCLKKEENFKKTKNEFDTSYKEYIKTKKELEDILENENKLEDLKEYTKFEIEKIESINPSIDEYEELSILKKRLTKKEKVQEMINKASGVFDFTQNVSSALELLEEDGSFFDEAINELNTIFENFNDSLYELEEIDIETVLDRIEKLSSLQKRFGSIKEALLYKDEKVKELKSYENISFEKQQLEKKLNTLEEKVYTLAKDLSLFRTNALKILEERVNYYLKFLYLSDAKFEIMSKTLDNTGLDEVVLSLKSISLEKISLGEFNRLRLSLLTSISEFDIEKNGVLFLDEIDANLSGKESEAIAKVLKKLSSTYQIFAISHQVQLSATSQQHFLVDKKYGKSQVKLLQEEQRVNELARMISGEEISEEALRFAKNSLNK